MNLNKYQAKILEILFDKLPIDGEVDSLEFALSGNFSGKYRAAYSEINDGDNYVVFNIPTYGSSVFLALASGHPQDVARILANLEDYERESVVNLGLGEVVITPAGLASDAHNPFAVILLRTATSLDCAGVPDRLTIEGRPTSFFLAVPISQKEQQLRHEEGHDVLMDSFEADQKDIFF